jgi:integrase
MPIYKTTGKKDGLQKYNVRINYTGDNGKSKQLTRTAYGLEAAKDLERQLSTEVKNKGVNSVKKMTVQQIYDEYTNVRKYELRETSIRINRQLYELYIKPTMENVRLDKLSVVKLQEWKLSVEEKDLSPATKKKAYSAFRAILNYAVKMEYIERNPILKIGNFINALEKDAKTDVVFYTAQEFIQYINAAKQKAVERQVKHNDLSEWEYYVFFNIAFYTGLRKGEVHALKWSDIDGSLLSVTRSIAQKLQGADRETPPKNKSSVRTLQIPLPLMKILNEHMIRQQNLEHFTDDCRICGCTRSLRDSTLFVKNINYATQAGLKPIKIHGFRHSHVSVLANEGINIQEIARRLGHAKVEETWNTYSHLYPREEEKAVDVLNKIA